MIKSLEEFLATVRTHKAASGQQLVWFRGEPKGVKTSLLPRLYRLRPDGGKHHENKLLQNFRVRAPIFAAHPAPHREATDQWLFLAQHHGLPTRLLDWTESALVGLYFALLEPTKQEDSRPPPVWMIPPFELNRLTSPDLGCEFPLTFLGLPNVRAAWEKGKHADQHPMAIQPTNIHPRMSVQRSCFRIRGADERSLIDQVPKLLKVCEIEPGSTAAMSEDLRVLGISHSTVWPDLDGLANELRELF
jgi:hypothetical protein